MTCKDLRDSIIAAVTTEIQLRGYAEYMAVPQTTERKSNFDAHLKLTQAGKLRFCPKASYPSTQIIHKDLKGLTINGIQVPASLADRLEEFKNHGNKQVADFITWLEGQR